MNLIHINDSQPRQEHIFKKGSGMQLFNSTKDYGAIPQALHWLTVFLVALAWALGTFDDVLPKGGPRDSGLFVHICAGIAILSLLVARLTWRLVDPAPPPEATEFGAWMGKWLDPAARIAHYSLCFAGSSSCRWHCASVCAWRCPAAIWSGRDSIALAQGSCLRP